MSEVNCIYEKIKASEMNDWVGGSDPRQVGNACYQILDRYISIGESSHLLDFGCGIGRVLLSVLEHRPALGKITGFDIMPQVIEFCSSNIATIFPKTSFELIRDSNDHYDQFIESAGKSEAVNKDQVLEHYRDTFSGVYAFSVFTHVEATDFSSLLKFVAQMMKPGGEFLFTAFLLTPFSRQSIYKRACLFPFETDAYEKDEQIFIGDTRDRLGFIAFDLLLVEKMVFDAGLVITHIEHGAWSGSGFSSSLQDVIVVRRPNPRSGDIQHVPTVARAPRLP